MKNGWAARRPRCSWAAGARGYGRLRSAAVAGGLLFTVTLCTFWLSPVHYITDSKYSMLLSQSLLDYGSFALDHYAIPRLPPTPYGGWVANGNLYQLEIVNDHLYYFFPPGSAILSVPYVSLMNAVGVSAANADRTYNVHGELQIQASLAALLMAALAAVFFLTSRCLLPLGWSMLMALGGAFGTQVWSTASRALWGDTWAILLLGLVVFMLLAQEVGRGRIHPVLFASLLAWMYFTRPTNAVHILAISAYLLVRHRRVLFWYAVTGALWFALFVVYSWQHFGQILPNYYLANRLGFGSFWVAAMGNLISPSRGLFVYVPVLLFIAYLLARYRHALGFPELIVLALSVSVGHLLVHSMFLPWYGGGCYGPRYSTGLVPWFVLLGILGIKAMLTWRETHGVEISSPNWAMPLATGAFCLSFSVFMNARGAISQDTWLWNANPVSIDDQPGRIWDWRQPQFLAGWLPMPLPRDFPLAEALVDLTASEADKYLVRGWSPSEPSYRWTTGQQAAIIFALREIADTALYLSLQPFLVPGRHYQQRVHLELNSQPLMTLVLREPGAKVYSLDLPSNMLRQNNLLTLRLPDATSPRALQVNDDPRRLAVSAQWMQLGPQSLSGMLAAPLLPEEFPEVEGRIDVTAPEAGKYLVQGWSGPEARFRWSDGERATIIFSLRETTNTVLSMTLQPFLVPGKHEEQRVNVELNGQRLTTLTLWQANPKRYSLFLARRLLRQKNVLLLGLPNAVAPKAYTISDDPRALGISLQGLEFEVQAANQ